VLRSIFGLEREEVAGDWRQLHNEELHTLYASLYFVSVIRSKTMIWDGNIARI
jgi:hypothetical protein